MKYCKKQNFIVKIESSNKKAPDFEVGGVNSEGLVACEHVNQFCWHVHPGKTGLTWKIRYLPVL